MPLNIPQINKLNRISTKHKRLLMVSNAPDSDPFTLFFYKNQ